MAPDGARGRIARALTAALLLLARAAAAAPPTIWTDPAGDALVRRTDVGNSGTINPQQHRLPDILETRIGRFAPNEPECNLFLGAWSTSGGFMRLDVVLAGLMNPPGPLGYDSKWPVYAPFLYGPNAVFGFVEVDMDNDFDTGGEADAPQYRYLGALGRFGGTPAGILSERMAYDASCLDGDLLTGPAVERSGEEFHLAFLAEEVEWIEIRTEKPGGNPGLFESGEEWWLHGRLWHRAHGFEDFATICPARNGRYEPDVTVRVRHDSVSDRTTFSLVYPLTHAAAASMNDPPGGYEPLNGCDYDRNSIEEALSGLKSSAAAAGPYDRMQPGFQFIAGWEFKNISAQLNADAWRIDALLGTAYPVEPLVSDTFIWTDAQPNSCFGDFNGDGVLDSADLGLLNAYIADHDGDPQFDSDGDGGNGQLTVPDFAQRFCLYDTNYDGIVQATDAVLLGDLDINQVVDLDDVDDFVRALVDPAGYPPSHAGWSPVPRGDFNGDGRLDGADIAGFCNRIIAGP
ncbi:MAG: dockerin type I repeat-containing protein [Phycisphaerae bacterium]